MILYKDRTCAVNRLKQMPVIQRAIVEWFQAKIGTRWMSCYLVSPGLYKAEESWSPEWKKEDHVKEQGYLVLSQAEAKEISW